MEILLLNPMTTLGVESGILFNLDRYLLQNAIATRIAYRYKPL